MATKNQSPARGNRGGAWQEVSSWQNASSVNSKVGTRTQGRWAWQADLLASKLKPRAKVVGIVLANYVNDERGDLKVWPSQGTLAAKCGATDRNVRRGLKELLAGKYLEIVEGEGGGGLRKDGTGRTTLYKLTFPMGKPGQVGPGIDGANPDRIDQIPGQNRSDTRTDLSDKLTTELTYEPTKKADDDERLKTAESESRLPGIDYSNLNCIEQLPEGLVRQARDDKTAWLYASRSATHFLGYERSDKPDGVNADTFVMAFIPAAALAQTLRLCRAGTLSNATVAEATLALGIPKAQ